VVSMGRRNTRLEPPGIENKSQTRLLELDQPEHCSNWVLTEYSQTGSSPAGALLNLRTGWCCTGPLNPHD